MVYPFSYGYFDHPTEIFQKLTETMADIAFTNASDGVGKNCLCYRPCMTFQSIVLFTGCQAH